MERYSPYLTLHSINVDIKLILLPLVLTKWKESNLLEEFSFWADVCKKSSFLTSHQLLDTKHLIVRDHTLLLHFDPLLHTQLPRNAAKFKIIHFSTEILLHMNPSYIYNRP